MTRPKVSIIVPVYNAVKYLDRTMTSLINQTLKDIEIICINDGSTDDSLKILQGYAAMDERIIVLDQEDLGQANACNRGLATATGEYVAECDSDDFVDKHMYKILYDEAKLHDADVVKCAAIELWPDRERINPMRSFAIPTHKPMCLRDIKNPTIRRDAFVRMNNLMTGIAKRSFLLENDIKYREGTNYEDTAVCFKIRAKADRYVFVEDYLYFYNRSNEHSGSATIRDNDAIIEQMDEIYRFNKAEGLDLEKEISLEEFYSYKWNLSRIDDTDAMMEFLIKIANKLSRHDIESDYFPNPHDAAYYRKLRYAVG